MWRKLTGQVLRYAVTGGIFTVGFGVLGGVMGYLGYLDWIPLVVNVSIPFIAVAKFLLHKYWVFSNNEPRWVQQPVVYFTIVGVVLAFYFGAQYLLTTLGVTQWLAFSIVTGVAIALRFLLFQRLFVPRPPTA